MLHAICATHGLHVLALCLGDCGIVCGKETGLCGLCDMSMSR